jgi:serine/threonine-protein kinase
VIGESVGDYRITAALGTGGVGEVYAAEHTASGDKVMLEIVHPQVTANLEATTKYLEWMKKLITVTHPGLVRVLDVHADPERSYVVRLPLEGEPLAKRIEDLGRLSLTQIAEIGKQLANTLAVVHEEDMVHGDLRPSCIYLVADPKGEIVKVLETGAAIAKRAAGIPVGPVYTAPEVWSAAAADWRIDAYSLGCVLFEMATGKPPYIGKSPEEVRAKHLSAKTPSARALMPDVPVALDVMLGRLLSKAPEDRYGSMRELARAFDAMMLGATRGSAPTAQDTPVFKPEGEVQAGVMSGELKARSKPPEDRPPEIEAGVVAEGAVIEIAPAMPIRVPSAGDTAMITRVKTGSGVWIVIVLVVLVAVGLAIALSR